LPDFLEMLGRHGVESIADVRRKPYSRRQPQYNREALATALAEAGFAYSHHETLGGLREPRADSPHVGLPLPLRGFGDHMETAAFHAALTQVIELSRRQRVAIMCVEASPLDCHRSLVSDALVARGEPVDHILDLDHREPHRLTAAARVVDGRPTYPANQAALDLTRP
jgi:uncharacterized protein (DUF488 family)